MRRHPDTDSIETVMIPQRLADAYGRNLLTMQLAQTPRSTDLALRKFVSRVYEQLAQANGWNLETEQTTVHLVESDRPLAHVLPGRHIVLSRGLVMALDDDERLMAALLAHEVAHVRARHSEQRLEAMFAISSVVGGARVGAGRHDQHWTWDVDGGMDYLHRRFEREQEREADSLALVYLECAGYHPQALVDLIRCFVGREQGDGAECLLGHDTPTKRCAELELFLRQSREHAHEQ